MKVKLSHFAGFCAFCALLLAYRAPLGAVLTGGVSMITALSTASGGDTSSAGSTVLSAEYIGALTDSGAILTDGYSALTSGGTPPLVTFETARDDLSAAHCYPVPFKPSAGHTKITFTALTGAARIRIYTISGELVRTLSKADTSDSLDWDVRNTGGSAVDSGVYLYLIEGTGKSKTGKLMVIR